MGIVSLDIVAKAFVEATITPALQAKGMSEEDVETTTNQMVDYYANGDGAKTMQASVDKLDILNSSIKDILTQLASAVTTANTAKIGPSVIVAGSATGATNPIFATALGSSLKSAYLSTASVVSFLLWEFESIGESLGISDSISGIAQGYKTTLSSVKASINSL